MPLTESSCDIHTLFLNAPHLIFHNFITSKSFHMQYMFFFFMFTWFLKMVLFSHMNIFISHDHIIFTWCRVVLGYNMVKCFTHVNTLFIQTQNLYSHVKITHYFSCFFVTFFNVVIATGGSCINIACSLFHSRVRAQAHSIKLESWNIIIIWENKWGSKPGSTMRNKEQETGNYVLDLTRQGAK